jgi:hypothetical protein
MIRNTATNTGDTSAATIVQQRQGMKKTPSQMDFDPLFHTPGRVFIIKWNVS